MGFLATNQTDHTSAQALWDESLDVGRKLNDLEIIAEVSTAREALTLCEQLHPDLVLMEVRLADMDGLTATRIIRRAAPDTRVLLFTMYEAADYVDEARRAGAHKPPARLTVRRPPHRRR